MSESRATRARRMVDEGYSIGQAAKTAGVSEFWLSLHYKDRPKLEQRRVE